MKVGLTTSAVLHAALIGFGLLTLSAPRALEVADVEAFPVDIVPVESITQIQQGDKKAVMKEKSAPLPTQQAGCRARGEEGGRRSCRHRQAADAGSQAEAGRDRGRAGACARTQAQADRRRQEGPAQAGRDQAGRCAGDRGDARSAAEAGGQARSGRRDHRRRNAGGGNHQAARRGAGAGIQAQAARGRRPPRRRTARKPTSRRKSRRTSRNPRRRNSTPTRSPPCSTRRSRPAAAPSVRPTRRRSAATRQQRREAVAKRDGCAARPARALLERCRPAPRTPRHLRVSVRFRLDHATASSRARRDGGDSPAATAQFDESAVRAVQKCDRNGLQVPDGQIGHLGRRRRQFRSERNVLSRRQNPTSRGLSL